MIKRPTVFVLGAGAGFEIGMCLGEDLMRRISRDVNIRFEGLVKQVSGDDRITESIRQHAQREGRDANKYFAAGRSIATGVAYAGSIDNYIHNHRKDELIKTVGKIGIVKNILEYERLSKIYIDEAKHPARFADVATAEKSWLHEFVRMVGDGLVVGVNLDEIFQNVAVVTFNYDRCLEHYLWKALQERFAINAARAAELVGSLEILHAYGTVAPLKWQDGSGVSFGAKEEGDYSLWASLAGNIRTYNEEVQDVVLKDKIHERILWAERLIFLGFHFHRQNTDLITPQAGEKKRAVKHGYATALDRETPELEIIKSQVGTMLRASAADGPVNLERVGCRKLFQIWGTTWAA